MIATTADTLVLIDDACYNVNHPLITQTLIEQPELAVKVIQSHAQARAMTTPNAITAITIQDLVSLTFTHEKVITWQ